MQESQMANCEKTDVPPDEEAEQTYISPDKIDVVQFAPPAELAPYVLQIYFFRCEESYIHDRQPAALGHLFFLLQGKGTLKFHDGHIDEIVSPGFALTPLGFAALAGKAANLYADRAVPASELFGPEIDDLAETFRKGHADGTIRIAQMAEMATAFLMKRIKPVPAAHVVLIQTVVNWLSSDLDPNVDVLYAQLDMSRSTAARLITRYFGCAPKPLMRKYRGVRAASILCDPACTPELRAKVESLFYDQPHMIREIRQFAGRTPGALDGDDSKILRLWLSKDSYRDVETYPG
jgi:AraC-like DNA-binding protein